MLTPLKYEDTCGNNRGTDNSKMKGILIRIVIRLWRNEVSLRFIQGIRLFLV